MNEFERITSKDNELIKHAAMLVSSAKLRRESGLFVLDGLRLCRDAVLNGFSLEVLIIGESAYNKFDAEAVLISKNAKRSCIVSDRLIAKISDTVNPQGFIAICKKTGEIDFELKSDGSYIALENIADPSNLGAIARTAEAFNFDGIIISDNGCDPYSPKSMRASMGALLRIPVIVVNDFTRYIKNLPLQTYAAVLDNSADNIREVKFTKGSVAIIGNEANGLTRETITASKIKVKIPMDGKAESLNASIAAAIFMWEMSKR